jgi:putative membrane protein insertion efficiency factor
MNSSRDFGKRAALALLRTYKAVVSPMFGPACRYVPSCSEYAMEAVEQHGAIKGGWMALRRVLRYDPVTAAGK